MRRLSLPIDCIDIAWVHKVYTDGQSPDDSLDFVALQLTYQAEAPSTGTFSVAGNATVGAQGLINTKGTFTLEKGRDGTLTVTDVDPNGAYVTGSLDTISFTTGTLSGTFTTEYCRNLVP